MYYKYVVFVFLFKLKQINCDGYTFENPIRFPYGAIQGPFIGVSSKIQFLHLFLINIFRYF